MLASDRELLQLDEGISPTVLSNRLARLVEAGVLTRVVDPTHRQKAIYSLTPMGIDLLDVVVHLGSWGRRYLVVPEGSAVPAALPMADDPGPWSHVRRQLQNRHLADALSSTLEVESTTPLSTPGTPNEVS